MTHSTESSVAMRNAVDRGGRCIDCRTCPIASWSSFAACAMSRSSGGGKAIGSNGSGSSGSIGAMRGARLRGSFDASATVAMLAAIGGAISASRTLSASWIAESATSVGSLLFFG